MRRMRQRLLTRRGRLPVILGGPTGAGKSLVARHFIHPRSKRKGQFVAVDLSTIPGISLPRSCSAPHVGRTRARSGTGLARSSRRMVGPFPDEVGNLGEDVQRMLLTVLRERSRIGDVHPRKVDELVVATNEDLGRWSGVTVPSGPVHADESAATVSCPARERRWTSSAC